MEAFVLLLIILNKHINVYISENKNTTSKTYNFLFEHFPPLLLLLLLCYYIAHCCLLWMIASAVCSNNNTVRITL